MVFKTKPALAVDMLTDLHAAGLLPPWATGDEVYGRDKTLREFCEHHRGGLRVRGAVFVHRHADLRPAGPRRPGAETGAAQGVEPRLVRCRVQRGPNLRVGVDRHRQPPPPPARAPQPDRPDRRGLLLLPTYPPAGPTTLPVLVAVAGRRWPVEEDFQVGKDQFGLDHSQVRLYTALLRHLVLTMTRPGRLRGDRRRDARSSPTPRPRHRSTPTTSHPKTPASSR